MGMEWMNYCCSAYSPGSNFEHLSVCWSPLRNFPATLGQKHTAPGQVLSAISSHLQVNTGQHRGWHKGEFFLVLYYHLICLSFFTWEVPSTLISLYNNPDGWIGQAGSTANCWSWVMGTRGLITLFSTPVLEFSIISVFFNSFIHATNIS